MQNRLFRFICILLGLATLTGCDRFPELSKHLARYGTEKCMGRKTDAISYLYLGPNTVCGIVDEMPYGGDRGDGPPAGPSPFVYHHALKIKSTLSMGPNYEDFFLNREITNSAEENESISEIDENCGLPNNWLQICASNTSHTAGPKPNFCALTIARKFTVLDTYLNGCPP